MKKQITMTELNMIQTHLDAIYGILGLTVRVTTQEYKAKSKSQLADAAGVSKETLNTWLTAMIHKEFFSSIDLDINTARVLPPRAVAYVCEFYDIVL